MGGESPKLLVNKPKKAQLKQFQQQKMKASETQPSSAPTVASTSASTASSSTGGGATPQPPRESFTRRYKFLWPLLLGVNFFVGAYLFTRTKNKNINEGEEDSAYSSASSSSSGSTAVSTAAIVEKSSASATAMKPVKSLPPIPEHQQRDLFKWMLGETRKIKPKDREEKKRIDDEKEILKAFIRAKSIPPI